VVVLGQVGVQRVPRLRARAALSFIRPVLTENGEQGAATTRSMA
jgi:hypothetical protein